MKLDLKGDVRVASLGAVDLAAKERARRIVELKIGQESKPVDLKLAASAGDYADTVTRTLTIKPNGFPITASFGGMVSAKAPAVHTVTLPAQRGARQREDVRAWCTRPRWPT